MCLPFHDLAERRLEKGVLHGYEYEIVANHTGHRCGYVRVEPGHPWFEQNYNNLDVDVHGGITFAEHGQACPTHGEEAEWWVGFDCAHGGDAPDPSIMDKADEDIGGRRLVDVMTFRGDTIKTTDYVRAECERLAEQALAAAK